MLKIALAPASVTHREVSQGGGTLLVAANQGGDHMNCPTAASQQRCLDKVVTENMAAKRLAATQDRQPRLRCERRRPNHRIVPPVIALRPMPPGDAMGDQRSVHAPRKLLHPREQRCAV